MTVTTSSPTIFTPSAIYGSGGVAVIAIIAYICTKTLLHKDANRKDKATFIWLIFDGLIHFIYEGSFLYLSVFGRQAATSSGPFAEIWKEYGKADYRWAVADPTVVSLEILTVLGAGPMCFYILRQIVKNDPARHYWLIVLSTAELYGGWMTFCPEWLTGSPSLTTSNWFHLWFYLVFMNVIWVVVPLWIMFDSYGHIATSLRATAADLKVKRN